jgi:hypothetical protein
LTREEWSCDLKQESHHFVMDPKKSPKINPTRKLKVQQKIQEKHHARPQLPREHGLKKEA